MNADFVLLDGRIATMDTAGREVAALAAHAGGSSRWATAMRCASTSARARGC